MPMKPMSVEQCVSEGLSGLLENRSRIVPGRLNRIMNALVPASLARKMEADMLGTALAASPLLQVLAARPSGGKRSPQAARTCKSQSVFLGDESNDLRDNAVC